MDFVGVGECLIDFTPSGTGGMGNPAFEMNPGGGVVNCVAAYTALGGSGAAICAVGRDLFGNFLIDKLKASHIDVSAVQVIDDVHTTLAVVSLQPNGERKFAFLRDPGADTQIDEAKIDFSLIEHCKALHFSSLSLCYGPALSATMACVRYAKAHGKLISFDPNFRPPLWQDTAKAIDAIKGGLRFADVVKLSEEEMELTLNVPRETPAKGAQRLMDMGVNTCYITYGAKGAYYADVTARGFVDGFTVKAVDTTGCGDAFSGAAMYFMLNHPAFDIAARTKLANACGAICATRMGAMMAMPTFDELMAFAG
ncbi:MAG: carbohydrate kinase [Clostridiales bacterium]|jgi:fructokinase|nr:carbohydrate kinase [Clostridiales bacterium]